LKSYAGPFGHYHGLWTPNGADFFIPFGLGQTMLADTFFNEIVLFKICIKKSICQHCLPKPKRDEKIGSIGRP
jgi:hypothetical protein